MVEAELLAQTSIKTLDDMKAAAKLLYDLGVKNVVIKGGNRLSKEKLSISFMMVVSFQSLKMTFLTQIILVLVVHWHQVLQVS